MPVVVNLKHIFELFWLYTTCFFDLETIGVNLMVTFGEKAKSKKGGKFELRS